MSHRLKFLAVIGVILALPAFLTAQTRSIISNLANPAIGMSALFLGNEAPNLDYPNEQGIQFQEAELSVISTVDPYWTLAANLVFAANPASGVPDTVEAEEAYAIAKQFEGVELQAVIHLEVPREELRRRLLARAGRDVMVVSDEFSHAVDVGLDIVSSVD